MDVQVTVCLIKIMCATCNQHLLNSVDSQIRVSNHVSGQTQIVNGVFFVQVTDFNSTDSAAKMALIVRIT
jgi:hypothetical protein